MAKAACPNALKAVHVCCGFPKHVDRENPPKAPAEAYPRLAPALDTAAIDADSVEDARRHNDLSLLEMFTRTSVIIGVVDISSSRVDTVDELRERLSAARHAPPTARPTGSVEDGGPPAEEVPD